MKLLTFFIFLLAFNYASHLNAQYENFSISKDQISIIHQTLDSIYNLNFEGANQLITLLEQELPEYPGIDLLKIYYLIWENKPLHSSNPIYDKFLIITEETLTKSNNKLENNQEDFEAQFYVLSIHAILARLYVDTGYNWKAIKEAQKSYKYIKRGMDYLELFPEFNLYCGIYNYYREKYPDDNPFVKPILWFFMNGDKEKGLHMLEYGAEYGLFTKIECITYLFHIYFRYEFMPERSIAYAKRLYQLYPRNETFIALLIENLLYLNQFTETKNLIDVIESSKQKHSRYIGKIYKGMYFELFEQDLKTAKNLYFEAMKIGKEYEVETPHYNSLWNLGLGRILLKQDFTSEAKKHLKLASKASEYRFVREEALNLLDEL